jgi:hypothetical protein
MTIEQWGAIGEVIGAVAVVCSLLYVGLQMRQNSKSVRSATATAATEISNNVYTPVIRDPELAEIAIRGLNDPNELNSVEMHRFTAHWHNSFIVLQNWFYQWREGNLDGDIWAGWSQVFCDLYTTPGIKQFWERRKGYFAAPFITYCESTLFQGEPTPGYIPLSSQLKAE